MFVTFAEREKKAFRASLLTANLDQQAMQEMQEKIERCTKILDHLETSDVIKVRAAVTSLLYRRAKSKNDSTDCDRD